MMKGKAWLFLTAAALLAVVAAGGFWVFDRAAAEAEVPGVVAANGRLEVRQVRVSSATGGRVLHLRRREGEAAQAGDTLAVLDSRRQSAAVAALEAAAAAADQGVVAAEQRALALESQLALARVEARRYRRLFERDAAPRQAAERAEATLAQLENEVPAAHAAHQLAVEQAAIAQAQVEGARAELDEAVVTAPVGGVVSEILVRQGEVAGPAFPIVGIRTSGDVVLRVYLPLVDAERVRPGAPARIRVDAFTSRVFEGAVESVASESEFTPRDIHMPDERTTLVYEVVVRVRDDEGALKDGFPADVRIRWDDAAAWPAKEPW